MADIARGNPYRIPSTTVRCPQCKGASKPHCPTMLEGCRWNKCAAGHVFDLKTKRIMPEPASGSEGDKS